MKFAIVLAVLATVALSASALPSRNEYALEENFGAIMKELKQRLQTVCQQIKETTQQLKDASEQAKEVLKSNLEDLRRELLEISRQLRTQLFNIFRPQQETYFIGGAKDKIAAIYQAIAEKATDLAAVLKQMAIETATPKVEELLKLKDQLLKGIENLNAEIYKKFLDIVFGEGHGLSDDADIIAEVKKQLQRKIDQVNELLNQKKEELINAVGQQKQELEALIDDLKVELWSLKGDLSAAFNKLIGAETYIIDRATIVEKVKELNDAIRQKLDILQEKVEMAKVLTGAAKEDALKAAAALKKQLIQIKEDFVAGIREALKSN